MSKKKSSKLALGTLIGVGVGYAAGVLTAPKSGKETRKDLQIRALASKARAEKNLKQLHSELTTLISRGKKQAGAAGTKAKAELSSALGKAQKAKQKTRELLSALHEGEAEDQDLDRAISNGKRAINNLKKYISKDDTKKNSKNK